MGFDKNQVYQVLDWTHAKQNLHELLKLVSPKKRAVTIGKWEYLLWQGNIDALGKSIEETITGKADRERAMKKPVLSLSKHSPTTLRATGRECSMPILRRRGCREAAVMWNLC